MTDQTTLVRYVGTKEASHAAAVAAHERSKMLIALGKRVKWTVQEAEDEKSIKQRAFLHVAVLPQIAEQVTMPDGTRYAWQVWKEFWRARFLGDRYVLRAIPRWDEKLGRVVQPKRKTPHRERVSTEDLGVKSYSQYIDRVIDTAVLEFHVVFRFIAEEREEVRWKAKPRAVAAVASSVATA